MERLPVSQEVKRALEQARNQLPQKVHKGHMHEERVIHRPHETVYETVDTWVELIDYREHQ